MVNVFVSVGSYAYRGEIDIAWLTLVVHVLKQDSKTKATKIVDQWYRDHVLNMLHPFLS